MNVFDLCVEFHYWEFIIKRNIHVQKIEVEKIVLNIIFSELDFIKIPSATIYAEKCGLPFDISH